MDLEIVRSAKLNIMLASTPVDASPQALATWELIEPITVEIFSRKSTSIGLPAVPLSGTLTYAVEVDQYSTRSGYKRDGAWQGVLRSSERGAIYEY